MASKDSIDVLMTFIRSSGKGVPAEGTSIWDKNDIDMMKDFEDGSFFELDDFKFAVDLKGSEGGSSDGGGGGAPKPAGGNELHAKPGEETATGKAKAARTVGRSSSQFAGYIGGEINAKFEPDLKEVSITKEVDQSSPYLFQSCVTNESFLKAVLVKRKATGGTAFHEAFVRIEFKEPLITGIEWDEGEVIKETVKFVCRGFVLAYRQQYADGTLGDAKSAAWTAPRRLAQKSG